QAGEPAARTEGRFSENQLIGNADTVEVSSAAESSSCEIGALERRFLLGIVSQKIAKHRRAADLNTLEVGMAVEDGALEIRNSADVGVEESYVAKLKNDQPTGMVSILGKIGCTQQRIAANVDRLEAGRSSELCTFHLQVVGDFGAVEGDGPVD